MAIDADLLARIVRTDTYGNARATLPVITRSCATAGRQAGRQAASRRRLRVLRLAVNSDIRESSATRFHNRY